MTRVDFYVMSEKSESDADRLSCRLTSKAFEQGQSVFIHVASSERAATIDAMLWTFRDISFIPHARSDAPEASETPVLIGSQLVPTDCGVLLNLAHPAPECFGDFERVVEIVPLEASERNQARERYRYYQDQGVTPTTHEL
jgi:DNA polymerase-3 subunit chi